MDIHLDHHNYILKELVRAVKTLQLYPKDHPSLDIILDKCFTNLSKFITDEGEVTWIVDSENFYFNNDKLLSNSPSVLELAKEFFLRKIKEITFRTDLSFSDMKNFISILNIEPIALHAQGGIEVFLARKEVTGVLLNEMSYANLLKLIEEERQRQEELAEEETAEEEVEDFSDETMMSEEEMAAQMALEKENEYKRLLNNLESETDSLVYNDLSVRIAERVMPTLGLGDYGPAMKVIEIYLNHIDTTIDTGDQKPDDIIMIAHRRLDDMLTNDLIDSLIANLANTDEGEREKVERILAHGGEHTQKLLITHLIETEDTTLRRIIYNLVMKFGETLRPEILSRLGDERWYAVRQMVALLAELSGEESLTALEETYKHPDVRVKKEVLKAFARIPSPKSLSILLDGLKNKDHAIKAQSLISLSILKDPNAVKPLGEIAVKRDLLNEDKGLKKEAVKALGLIGDLAGVPYLETILNTRKWFDSGEDDGIKALAATSLGKIGGEQAAKVLEKACKRNKGNIYNACKRALEGITK